MNQAELRRNQIIGMLTGVLLAAMTANFFPDLREAVGGWAGALLWGGAIGAALASLSQFAEAGKLVTRSDNRVLNLIVALVIVVVLIALCAVLFRLTVGLVPV